MKKRNILVVGITAFLLAISVGYALFSETLEISGTATAKGNFDVEFTSVEVIDENGSTNASFEISTDKNELSITVPKLEYPGAYAEYKITVTNKGSIPAVLENIEKINLTDDPTVKVSYTGLDELVNQELTQNGTQTFNIKVMWDENSKVKAENVEFTFKLNYKQVTA